MAFPSIPQQNYPTHNIITRTVQIVLNPTVTASSAYAAGNSVGGLLKFTNIAGPQKSGVIQSFFVNCKTAQTTTFKLYVFNALPAFTTITNKATPSLNANDVPYLIGVYTTGSSDSTLTATINLLDAIGKSFTSYSSDLYGILVCVSTPTFNAASDVFVGLSVLQD